MRYLTLSSDSSHFQYDSAGDNVTFKWNISENFSNIAYIGISSIIITGLKQSKTDTMISILTNLISRTIGNPRRNIINLRLPRHSSLAQCQLNMSKLLILLLSKHKNVIFSELHDWS